MQTKACLGDCEASSCTMASKQTRFLRPNLSTGTQLLRSCVHTQHHRSDSDYKAGHYMLALMQEQKLLTAGVRVTEGQVGIIDDP